jgi:prepilin peptidase CpaA
MSVCSTNWHGGHPPCPELSGYGGFSFFSTLYTKRFALTWCILLLALIAVVYDLRTREVPDWISLAILACAIVAAAFGYGNVQWFGLFAGCTLGFLCSMPVFCLGGFGGADVKLLAAFGAVLGPVHFFCMFFWTAMAGAILASISMFCGKRDFAYIPAIVIGFTIQTLWSEGLRNVLFP